MHAISPGMTPPSYAQGTVSCKYDSTFNCLLPPTAQLEALTVTPQERWQSLLSEVELEVSRKMLALQAEARRLLDNARLTPTKRAELLASR